MNYLITCLISKCVPVAPLISVGFITCTKDVSCALLNQNRLTNDYQELELYATCTQKPIKSPGKLVYMVFSSLSSCKMQMYIFFLTPVVGFFGFGWLYEWVKSTFSTKSLYRWLSSTPAGWSCLGLPAASWTCLSLWIWTLLVSHWANNLYYCDTDAISLLGEGEELSASVQNKDFMLWIWQCCSSLYFTYCSRMCRPELSSCSCESGTFLKLLLTCFSSDCLCLWLVLNSFSAPHNQVLHAACVCSTEKCFLTFLTPKLKLHRHVCEQWGRLDESSDWNGSPTGSLRTQTECR